MDIQFQYITQLAEKYEQFAKQPAELFTAINQLSENVVQEIFDEYGDSESRFQPVNLLRAEIARQLLLGTEVTDTFVEKIKNHIRTKDTAYFAHLPENFLQELSEYLIGKRDIFANWQKPWNVLHVFFYRGKVRETTQVYLEQLGKQLISDLQLPDYTVHWVDFQGASNFGSDRCWLSLYPLNRTSHKVAYQFHLRLDSTPEAGMYSGSDLKDSLPEQMENVTTYEDILRVFNNFKQEILGLNKAARNYFKFMPGGFSSKWEEFKSESVIALHYSKREIGDISQIQSNEELNIAFGLAPETISNESWNLWLFKTANKGDVVFASKGQNTCLGIGIIEGDYYYDTNALDHNHRRKVKWITDKVYQYNANDLRGYKNLFRFDSFSPTKVWEFILKEYVRLYPDLKEVFDQNGLKYESDSSRPVEQITIAETDDGDTGTANYWWMNANPAIWSISEFNEGERQTYTSRNEKGNKRRIYKHFEAVKPGDFIIGYESSPVKQIKGILEITKALHQSEEEGEVIEFELVEKLEVPVHWSELQNNPALKNCEPFINNQGSLFKLEEEEFDVIREAIDNKNIVQEKRLESSDIKPYVFSEDADKPFILEADFLQAVELLKRKKNIILQGAPGVGKTFVARKLAYQIIGSVNDAQIEMVQFHQSYSYEDFVQGLRPSKTSFELRNGIFYNFCQQAFAHPDRDFFLIIDEINRGNLSKIFGELMMLIEADKRDNKYALKLTYSEDADDRFFVPPNLYIIGTMNTADRSLAIVDYALRRRFAFVTLQPEFGEMFQSFLADKGVSSSLITRLCSSIGRVNNEIKNDVNLGAGFQIGHSYFCGFKNNNDENQWLNEVFNFEIKPLLEEIWFDDSNKVDEVMAQLSR
jgi:5-methylcytosine-specific restriction protein B